MFSPLKTTLSLVTSLHPLADVCFHISREFTKLCLFPFFLVIPFCNEFFLLLHQYSQKIGGKYFWWGCYLAIQFALLVGAEGCELLITCRKFSLHGSPLIWVCQKECEGRKSANFFRKKKKRLRTCALGKYGDHAKYTFALFIPHSLVLGTVESSWKGL